MISNLMKRIPSLHRIARKRYPHIKMAWNADVQSWVFTSDLVPEFHVYICDHLAKWETLEGKQTEHCLAIWDYWNTEEDESIVGLSSYPEQAMVYIYKTLTDAEVESTLFK